MKNRIQRLGAGGVVALLTAAGLLVAVGAAPVPSTVDEPLPVQSVPGPVGSEQQVIDVRDTVQRSFDVEPGGMLRLEADRGSIDITTGDSRTLRVEVVRNVNTDNREKAQRILRQHRVSFNQQSNTVRVVASYEGNDGIWGWRKDDGDGLDVTLRVVMPQRFNVDFATGAGSVSIGDVQGDVSGETGAGNMRLGEIQGTVRLNSGAGNIGVERSGGVLAVETGAGNVKLRDVRSRATVNTGAGNITAIITEQLSEATTLETGAGNVTVYLADQIGADVRASTGVGSAHTDFPLAVDEGWVGTSIEGQIRQGGPRLKLSAGMGNVALKKRRP